MRVRKASTGITQWVCSRCTESIGGLAQVIRECGIVSRGAIGYDITRDGDKLDDTIVKQHYTPAAEKTMSSGNDTKSTNAINQ